MYFWLTLFSHAALRFKDTQRVSEILATKEFTILGKKVFAVQAHRSLLQNHPQLGQDSSDEMKSVPQIVKVFIYIFLFSTANFRINRFFFFFLGERQWSTKP